MACELVYIYSPHMINSACGSVHILLFLNLYPKVVVMCSNGPLAPVCLNQPFQVDQILTAYSI